uniref:Glucose-methanol-choline oxidoreductase N-terminal domain-containing protein n=1 Tax=Monopterus albus TaxID=43700 RepID=A0A3Q3Q6Z6_MONAL
QLEAGEDWKNTGPFFSCSFSSNHYRCFSASAAANQKTPSYSYIIVGAGSAGCVLANRLSEDAHESVMLLEAGPKDRFLGSVRLSWKIHMPAALIYNLCDDKYNWFYNTLPQANVDNRVMYWPRGRVWGGSSSLNAMVYIRGHAEDYNRWQREGAEGWDYEHCLPYFRKAQSHELGENSYRGGSGPLHVTRGKTNHPLHRAFIEAGQQAGYPFTDDMNGYQQEGVGWMDMTIYKGKRWNTASAYLRPALGRPNLKTEVCCLTTKILFDGNRAVGVEYTQKGQKKRIFADKEVILSGGAINSPQLLMLLLGTPASSHSVGSNLQDHLELYVQQQCTQPITLHKAQKPFQMVKIGLEWLTTFTGYGATAHMESGGFIRSRPLVTHPDIEFHFLPSQIIDHGRVASKIEAYQVHVGPMRSTSIGWIKLKSANPLDHPNINPNYLSTDIDVWEFRECVKLSREIFAQKAFDPFRGPEVLPGPQVQSDADIDAFVRQKADTAYHPSCTCKMGSPSDPMAVVDPNTRVLGLERLHVVDASIMPSIISGNLNAPTIMMAEKAADIIRGRPPLVSPRVPVYRPSTLDTQR